MSAYLDLELPYLQACMFNLLCKLYAAMKRGHQVVTQAASDVTMM